jgi:hypothetical protein
MRYGGYFWCHEDQMWQDSLTYGNWRQYICNRYGPQGPTQCARFSLFPVFGLLLGLTLLIAVAIAVASAPYEWLRWWVVGLLTVLGCLLTVPFFLGWLDGLYLMVPVGPLNDGARRVCPWDTKQGKAAADVKGRPPRYH